WHKDNFDADRLTDILAGSKYSIPLLWLLCFDSESLTHTAATNSDPPGSCPPRSSTTTGPPDCSPSAGPGSTAGPARTDSSTSSAELLRGCGFGYLKLDLADMDTFVSDLTGHLTRALRWFDSDDETFSAVRSPGPVGRRGRRRTCARRFDRPSR